MAYVIIGLGNPEEAYAKTRHNAGRMAVEVFASKERFPEFSLRKAAKSLVSEGTIDGEKVQLVLPDVSMNLSGKVVPSFVKSVKAAQKLIVMRDELDLPLGAIKMTYGRGSGGHKGAESIMRTLKTKDFVQIKIGISSATSKGTLKKVSGEDEVIHHVIGKFSPKQEAELKAVLQRAASAARLYIAEGSDAAMLYANTKA